MNRDTQVITAGVALAWLGLILAWFTSNPWLGGSSNALLFVCLYFHVRTQRTRRKGPPRA